MRSFDSNPWSVQEILSGVAHCSIELPEFQRDFVWDPETKLKSQNLGPAETR